MLVPNDSMLPRRLWAELVQWRAGYRCERCLLNKQQLKAAGMTGRLAAHHRDHDKSNNRMSNGECLCASCRLKHHGGGSKPCKPGCKCKRHLPAHNRIQDGDLCPHGHNDWVVRPNGDVRCSTCVNEAAAKRYHENPAYRQRQIEGTTARRRAKREGGSSRK